MVLSHVAVAAAMELDHPALAGAAVGRELLVVDRVRAGDAEDPPAGVARGACRSRSRRSRRRRRGRGSRPAAAACAADEHRRRLHPADLAGALAAALGDQQAVQEERAGERGAEPRQPPRDGCGAPAGSSSCAPAAAARGSSRSASTSAATAPGRSSESSLSSRQSSPRASRSSRESFSALPARRSQLDQPQPLAEPAAAPRSSARLAPTEPSSEALSSTSTSDSIPAGAFADRVEAGGRYRAAVGVDDAVGQVHGENRRRCGSRSSIPRPSRRRTTARCARRSPRAGAEVELVTTRFPYGPVPEPEGYAVERALLPARRAARPGRRPRRRGAGARPSTCPACRACAPTRAPPTSSICSGWRRRPSTAPCCRRARACSPSTTRRPTAAGRSPPSAPSSSAWTR